MIITIHTTVDQDLGIESIHANYPLEERGDITIFAHKLINDFLNNLKPHVEARRVELIKASLDGITEEKILAIEAELRK